MVEEAVEEARKQDGFVCWWLFGGGWRRKSGTESGGKRRRREIESEIGVSEGVRGTDPSGGVAPPLRWGFRLVGMFDRMIPF